MERNFDGIQFEKLRRKIDPAFNLVHDELSDCYYNQKPFREYGILSKEQFDKLHGLIFLKRDVVFHQENLKQEMKDIIPEDKYNDIVDFDTKEIKGKKHLESGRRIIELKKEGIELII